MKVQTYDISESPVVSLDFIEGTIDKIFCDNFNNIKQMIILTDQMFYTFYTDDVIYKDQKVIFSFFTDLYIQRASKAKLRIQFTLKSKKDLTKIYIAYRPDKIYPFLDIPGTFYVVSKDTDLSSAQKKMITTIVSDKELFVVSNGNVIESRCENGYHMYDIKSDYKIYGIENYDVIRRVKFILSGGIMTIF